MSKLNMKLNNLGRDTFAVRPDHDEMVGQISRNQLIASGRLCATEYMGKTLSRNDGSYNSRLKEFGGDYAKLSQAHMEQKLIFCAARTYQVQGRPAPNSIEDVRKDRSLYKDPIFLRTLSAIDSEVVTPLLYSVFSDLGGSMLNLSTVAVGETKEVNILSNDIFLWEDSAPGSGHSTTKNYLYADTITLNPRMYSCNGTIKWFQMIAIDGGMDAGWYYAAILQGLWSKIMAIYTSSLLTAAANQVYVPSYLAFSSYNSANWAAATTAVAVANGVRRDQLMAFGEYGALQVVLPSGTPSDAALTYGLGEEWMRNGFVSMVGRVPLFEVMPALIPGTVNTSGTMIGLGDKIFITARVGNSLAPIYGVMADGWPLMLEYSASETADFEISINASALMDFKAVMAGKMAVISNVTFPDNN